MLSAHFRETTMIHDADARLRSCLAPARTAHETAGRTAGSRLAWRRADGPRAGSVCRSRPMQPAALRVLETTRRVWREPLA
jgi:hypothetical protein